LTNILAIFLQHLRMIPCPVKHKQTKTTQQQVQSHLKKVDVSRFPVVSKTAKLHTIYEQQNIKD